MGSSVILKRTCSGLAKQASKKRIKKMQISFKFFFLSYFYASRYVQLLAQIVQSLFLSI